MFVVRDWSNRIIVGGMEGKSTKVKTKNCAQLTTSPWFCIDFTLLVSSVFAFLCLTESGKKKGWAHRWDTFVLMQILIRL